MAEHINNSDLLGSGGHVWLWDDQRRTRKSVESAAIVGAYTSIGAWGARLGRIEGKGGTRAVLKASGASQAAADAAMGLVEAAIEELANSGQESAWEDDCGRSGTALVLLNYRRSGHRIYSVHGASTVVWQYYTLDFQENDGGWP